MDVQVGLLRFTCEHVYRELHSQTKRYENVSSAGYGYAYPRSGRHGDGVVWCAAELELQSLEGTYHRIFLHPDHASDNRTRVCCIVNLTPCILLSSLVYMTLHTTRHHMP